MRLTDFITRDLVLDNLQSTSRESVIDELVDHLIHRTKLGNASKADLVSAIMTREILRSTGIGGGFAVPHAKHVSMDSTIGVFARSRKGVDFALPDGESVYGMCLVLSGKGDTRSYLEAIALSARLLQDETWRRFFEQAKDTEDLWKMLQDADERISIR